MVCIMVQAFMGEVAMWTGVVTGSLMFASPILFDRLGWRGVAGATPTFMLFAGMPFFAGVSIYAFLSMHAAAPPAAAVLKTLVIVGAIIQVLLRHAHIASVAVCQTCHRPPPHNMTRVCVKQVTGSCKLRMFCSIRFCAL